MSVANITSSFRVTGIFPIDPQIIPDAAFAPSVLFRMPVKNVETSDEESDIPLSVLRERVIQSKLADPLLGSSKPADQHAENLPGPPTAVAKVLENLPRPTFSKMLKTPQLSAKQTQTVRRKAINYRAQQVTKDLFQERDETKATEGTRFT